MDIQSIADLIHLSVAPIFLLTAVAATLTALMHRLARIVDRGRFIERQSVPDRKELLLLEQRARLIYRAMVLGVTAALCVSLLMTLVFAGSVLHFNAAKAVSLLFMGALFAYTGALLCLLREVFLAVGSFRLGIHTAAAPADPAKAS